MTSTLTTSDARPTGRAANVVLWVIQASIAVQFVMGGILKVTGNPAMVEMFATIGAGQWLRYVVGVLEIAGAVGLLIPRVRVATAGGIAALMAGATITNVFILGASPLLPLVLLVASAGIIYGRWPRQRR